MPPIVIGIDAHKSSHTCAAVDGMGRVLAVKTVAATTAGHMNLMAWARMSFGDDLKFGVEDVRVVTRRLEEDLFGAGQVVVRVPANTMGRVRASGRARGKSDPIDATAVARAVLREPDLPEAFQDPLSRAFGLLINRRDVLVHQRTATITRVIWRIHELDPERGSSLGSLNYEVHRDPLDRWLATQSGVVAEIARQELSEVAVLSTKIGDLRKRISKDARQSLPNMLTVVGCGELMAAKIVGETGSPRRFKDEAAFARYAGVAPLPHWSGSTEGRMRMTRSGNRQLNMALHRIAVVQIQREGPGQRYYRRRREMGDNYYSAMRRLKRRIVRVVFSRMTTDLRAHAERTADDQTTRSSGS
ncbi:IS110 family transposase [Mycobacterium sp. 236(2023)]|uniref:IS110 family transposase n=1 Tax=Mycobacterium sp. 236(2023) TaxID=3038163 RepID=UPI0024157ED1|nr:IS110 family transposase [Mycobacterium sp. 236(2023)]MDG4667982.1 IS110 family transposase [Mycobacterium sp. 236(2023)]